MLAFADFPSGVERLCEGVALAECALSVSTAGWGAVATSVVIVHGSQTIAS
jgi:hypothetical protein